MADARSDIGQGADHAPVLHNRGVGTPKHTPSVVQPDSVVPDRCQRDKPTTSRVRARCQLCPHRPPMAWVVSRLPITFGSGGPSCRILSLPARRGSSQLAEDAQVGDGQRVSHREAALRGRQPLLEPAEPEMQHPAAVFPQRLARRKPRLPLFERCFGS